MSLNRDPTIAVIGLGYVGLPLAIEFGKKFRTIGFDLSQHKIDAYSCHIDPTGEVATADLKAAVREGGLEPTTDPRRPASADFPRPGVAPSCGLKNNERIAPPGFSGFNGIANTGSAS